MQKKKSKAGTIIGRILATIFTTLAIVFVGLYATMWIFCHGPSEAGRNMFVNTIMETGAMRFLANWYFTKDEIMEITNNDSMVHNDANVDENLIAVVGDGEGDSSQFDDNFDENGVEIIDITGRSYHGVLMKVKDPSKVVLSTIYPWSDDSKSKDGVTLDVLVQMKDALGGINGGEYYSDGNWGGKPKGLVVCDGEIQYNKPQNGDVMVGFNTSNILIIKDIGNLSSAEVEKLVADENIRDAISFKDIADGDVNHFTKLIINGVATEINGSGSGANPRTVIGQRSDGAVLMFTADGRGANGHIGATAADLIGIMQEYGAVNAANLDGGSSSSMYYDGEWLQTSVTFYYSTSSWKLPTGFVVK